LRVGNHTVWESKVVSINHPSGKPLLSGCCSGNDNFKYEFISSTKADPTFDQFA
jgi:hypothetical protein